MTQRAKKHLEYTLSTHAIEKLTPSDEAIRLCVQVSDGKISADAAVASILQQYGYSREVTHG